MKARKNENYFIAVEGMDGCGKDTQINNLVNYFKDKNKYANVLVTREPTKITGPGRMIGDLLKTDRLTKEDATELFINDRIEHSYIIEQQLVHSHVISSRYDLSTLSYQMTQGMEFEVLYDKHKYNKYRGCLIPDVTIVLDIDVTEALKRINKRDDGKEFFENRPFLTSLYANLYKATEEIKLRDDRKILVVNGKQSPEVVKTEMLKKLDEILK